VRLTVRITAEADPLLDNATIRRALAPAFYVAAVAREVERPTRLRLGSQESIEALTPREILERFLIARQTPRERIEWLLRYADGLLTTAEE
jgi:hypothetical protein